MLYVNEDGNNKITLKFNNKIIEFKQTSKPTNIKSNSVWIGCVFKCVKTERRFTSSTYTHTFIWNILEDVIDFLFFILYLNYVSTIFIESYKISEKSVHIVLHYVGECVCVFLCMNFFTFVLSSSIFILLQIQNIKNFNKRDDFKILLFASSNRFIWFSAFVNVHAPHIRDAQCFKSFR